MLLLLVSKKYKIGVFEHSGTVIELRERVDRQSEDIQKLVTNLSVENIRMKERVQELEKLYDMSVDDKVSLNLRVEDLELMIEYLVKDLPAVMVAPEADLG